jgi:hypothetical protein
MVFRVTRDSACSSFVHEESSPHLARTSPMAHQQTRIKRAEEDSFPYWAHSWTRNARARNRRVLFWVLRFWKNSHRHGVWIPAFAGTTSSVMRSGRDRPCGAVASSAIRSSQDMRAFSRADSVAKRRSRISSGSAADSRAGSWPGN